MNEQLSSMQIRRQELAQAILDARLACRCDPEETAAAVGIPVALFQAFETGEHSPTLPVLDLLAFYFDVPVERFCIPPTEKKARPDTLEMKEQFRQLRNRVIAVRLRLARASKNLTLPQVADASGIEEERLRAQETAQEPLPLPELEQVCHALGLPITDLFAERGPIGLWRAQHTAEENLMQLPPDVQNFLCQPVNMPYISLAMRLSQLGVERLRSIAEGLLEIAS